MSVLSVICLVLAVAGASVTTYVLVRVLRHPELQSERAGRRFYPTMTVLSYGFLVCMVMLTLRFPTEHWLYAILTVLIMSAPLLAIYELREKLRESASV